MVSARRIYSGGSLAVASVIALTVAWEPSPAAAAPAWVKKILPFGRAGEGRPPAPVTGRYASDAGVLFILDRGGGRPLLKFEDSPEVWALVPASGPRGDILYTDDVGELFLRATRLGGMTLFTASRPGGSAVALLGPCPPLRLSSLGLFRYSQRIYQASARATRASQHTVIFDGPGGDPKSRSPPADLSNDGLIADAAAVAADAVVVLAAHGGGRGVAAGLTTVALDIGARPEVSYRAGVIRITVVPSQGYAGRPSSRRILRALGMR